MKIKIAVPSKGRISEPSINILEKAGLGLIDKNNRKLISKTFNENIEVMFARASDIPEFVNDGVADMGITGVDLIQENEADVEELLDLRFGQTKLVLAAPEDSNVNSVEDITEDMIDTILESTIKIIANKDSLNDKKELIEAVTTSIRGVLDAERKKLIMMNVKSVDLDKVKEVMPSMGGLTISEVLSSEKTVAVQAVIDEKQVFELVNDLRNAGAKDILVVPIERII